VRIRGYIGPGQALLSRNLAVCDPGHRGSRIHPGSAGIRAALARKVRAGEIGTRSAAAALGESETDWDKIFVKLLLTAELAESAVRLLLEYPLKGADAVHLANAMASEAELFVASPDGRLPKASVKQEWVFTTHREDPSAGGHPEPRHQLSAPLWFWPNTPPFPLSSARTAQTYLTIALHPYMFLPSSGGCHGRTAASTTVFALESEREREEEKEKSGDSRRCENKSRRSFPD